MARNEARRQKQVMKKRQKDKQRRRRQVELATLHNPHNQIRLARRYPVHECLINPSWADKGLATILLSRRQPNGDLIFGLFLVDVWCLGVKDTFCQGNVTPYKYRAEVVAKMFHETPVPCAPSVAGQIVYGAIAFARQFGFEPHPDFALSHHLLDPPEAYVPSDEIVFGRDGKPYYVGGPHDNVGQILRQLDTAAGADHYDYTVPVPDGPSSILDSDG